MVLGGTEGRSVIANRVLRVGGGGNGELTVNQLPMRKGGS